MVAEESVGKAVLADNLVENTEEIVNILARLLNSAKTPQIAMSACVPGCS